MRYLGCRERGRTLILDIDIDPGLDEEVTDPTAGWKSRGGGYPRSSDTPRASTLDDAPLQSKELHRGTQVRSVSDSVEESNDSVRTYLREMGKIRLLTREGEVRLARRIERGQARVLRASSRSPVVLKELLGVLEDVRRGTLSVRDIVRFSAQDLAREKTVDQKIEQTLEALIGIEKLYRLALNQAARLESMPKSR